jgi:hypothetical protein
MSRYLVTVTRPTFDFELIYLDIEADTPDAATKIALHKASREDPEDEDIWDNARTEVGDTGAPEIVTVEETA